MTAGVRQVVREHNVFGVITVAEAWTYFPKGDKDHTSFQLLDGEMSVKDLKARDKMEALLVRAESRVGDNAVWLDRIERKDGKAALGAGLHLAKAKCLKMGSYLGND